ncbi:stage II sporulation protein GA (sporulation sigma-E factor processing peptidase) [Hathewaya proteolytica DSM 3090]|uniref:Sporulation sigma-E factor-processing peptidase n=1 Tax=Hathewaya proteolytica DSM 3090 TaxID=1121331 RepID=A0A1M6JC08_9CLOT|nr:sigma-E processing peptidase SpoIIGA [Hathewaya proteolytica]SHJ44276.1 stage II sporulation protein GA (sporulation sigma-E factor processing peptidase) [Hathewaya proteolytica DSM 3090]
MIIYWDMLILENTLVNYFVLILTFKTLNYKENLLKNAIAALVGALACLVVVFFNPGKGMVFLLKLITAIIMVAIASPFRIYNHIKDNIKIISTMCMYSMILGGMCIFLIYNESGNIIRNSYTMSMPYKKLILSMVMVYLIGERMVSYIKKRICIKDLIYKVKISVKGVEREVRGFMDTGNELVEPISNLPVIIVEKKVFEEVMVDKDKAYRIPYKVVSGNDGYLEGIMAEHILIEKNGFFEKKNAIVVFCDTKLSNVGEYSAILSKELLI